MLWTSRLAYVERGLGVAASTIGRVVTRAVGVLPRVVGQASGIEHPSPEAVAAGVVRGVTALAPLTLPVGARAVELAGVAGVVALATWSAQAELNDVAAIGDAVTELERRRLCGPRTALVWRVAVGAPVESPSPLSALLPDLGKVGRSALGSLSRKLAAHALASMTSAPVFRTVDAGLTLAGAWAAVGDAARLVEGTRAAAEQVAVREAAARRMLH